VSRRSGRVDYAKKKLMSKVRTKRNAVTQNNDKLFVSLPTAPPRYSIQKGYCSRCNTQRLLIYLIHADNEGLVCVKGEGCNVA